MELLASALVEVRTSPLQSPYRRCVWNLKMECWTTFCEVPEAVGKEFICLSEKTLSVASMLAPKLRCALPSHADINSQTLDFGNRSKQLSATVQRTPTELYSYTEGKENEITFTALQSHRLAMKKAQEDTLGADVALAKLQNQLASAEREKQARQ